MPTKRKRQVQAPWAITLADAVLRDETARAMSDRQLTEFHGIGDRAIVDQRIVGLICSIQCPGSVVIKTFDAIREIRDAGIAVAGGFHSPMERECLDFLLRGHQPIIVCPAKGLGNPRLPAEWRTAIDSGRLLVLSPFVDTARRTNKSRAQSRNEFVAALATAVLIPHASPGGKTETLSRELAAMGKRLFTFDDPENKPLVELGARPYNLNDVRQVTLLGI